MYTDSASLFIHTVECIRYVTLLALVARLLIRCLGLNRASSEQFRFFAYISAYTVE